MPADSVPSSKPRLRFAPSPTGPLHLGGARTALYNWAAARAMGGTFILRIEDTDRERSDDKWLATIFEGLRWLGIEWDEGPDRGGPAGPYVQMQRLPLYARYAERLLAQGDAYECFCTPEEVEAGRERQKAAGGRPMYDRRCRDLDAGRRAALRASGRSASIRYRVPLSGKVAIDDLCKGRIEVGCEEIDDWVMLRPDGIPLYNFACVVDDLEMGITHVVRGEEHTVNGFKQVLMFGALGAAAPQYAHIPLILGKDGRKLSKRDAITNILDYRDKGFLADAVFNYITLLGWSFSGDRDVFSRAELLERFRIDEIGKSGSKFDEDKLLWMSGDYVRRLPRADFVAAARPFLRGLVPDSAFAGAAGFLGNLLGCYQERVSVLAELKDKLAWAFGDTVTLDEEARGKFEKEPEARAWLRQYAEHLATLPLPPSFPADRAVADAQFLLPTPGGTAPDAIASAFAGPSRLEHDARAFTEGLGVKFGRFVHPVRAALTGTTKGPGLFDCLFLLGKERALARLRAAASS
ncbi:MAG: glutamate--tRNA ligase [Planctomycetes bacterium]|nr:glutamate--tRNA ligase [Planctomycetota bacterium]